MEEKKKIIGTVEIITLVLAVGIIGFILLKQGGVQILKRKESAEIIHTPGGHHWEESRQKFDLNQKGTINSSLKKLAKQFSNSEPIDMIYYKKKGFTKEELYFYEKLRSQYADQLHTPSDWYPLLANAHKTYQKVSNFFHDLSGQPTETLSEKDVAQLIDDTSNDVHFFDRLEQRFAIEHDQAKAFTRYNPNAVNDWAMFIFQQQQK